MNFTEQELELIRLALFSLRVETCGNETEAELYAKATALAEKLDAATV